MSVSSTTTNVMSDTEEGLQHDSCRHCDWTYWTYWNCYQKQYKCCGSERFENVL